MRKGYNHGGLRPVRGGGIARGVRGGAGSALVLPPGSLLANQHALPERAVIMLGA